MSIVFCGDFCLAASSKGESVVLKNGISPWSNVSKVFGTDSRIVANLECPITTLTKGKAYKWANLRMNPQYIGLFLDGLSFAILGNNHIGDFGEHAVRATEAHLAQSAIAYAGVGASIDDALTCNNIYINNINVGIVSLCCPSTNSEFIATHQLPGVAPLGIATLHASIQRARRLSDLVVVYPHWGREWVHDPSPDQVRLARFAIDSGADAVIGCHSHTVQSYEMYKDKWIFYGLGNFCFDAGYAQSLESDGSLSIVPLTLSRENMESLIVSFIPENMNGNYALRLNKIQAFSFDQSFLPAPMDLSELSFSLEEASFRLQSFVNKNKDWLQSLDEPEFVSRLLNGSSMAYWYRHPSFESVEPPQLSRISALKSVTARRIRKLFHYFSK